MTTRRRFRGEFKARVALEALRGDKTVQEIASKHKVHPNQVSTWKRQAIEGLPFLNTYRTMCVAPKPEFRRILEEIRDMRLAA